jgi:hypothetical protein
MRIVLALSAVDPPVGTATFESAQPIAFSGWLGLLAAIHALVPADDDPNQSVNARVSRMESRPTGHARGGEASHD